MLPSSYQIDDNNKWGWITLYVVTIVIAILGNLLFIVSCLCTKRTRTTGYYLLINLSIRDILVAALCVPFTLDTEVSFSNSGIFKFQNKSDSESVIIAIYACPGIIV